METLAWIGVIGTLGLLPFVWKDLPTAFSGNNLWILLGLGLLTFVITLMDFEALKRGKLSVIDVVFEVELPITIILGMTFFGERLSLGQWGAVGAIFVGILLIAIDPKELKGVFAIEAGVLIAFVAAIGMGGVNFLTALGAKEASPLLAIWFPWFVFTFFCLLVMIFQRDFKAFAAHIKTFPGLILSMGFFDTLAWLLFAIAVLDAELAITVAITESYPAVALFLGVWLNREKVAWHQGLGAVITIAASVTIGFL